MIIFLSLTSFVELQIIASNGSITTFIHFPLALVTEEAGAMGISGV